MLDTLIVRVVPYIAYAYLTLVGWTSRIRFEGWDAIEEFDRRNERYLYAPWHCRHLLLAYTHRNKNIGILVSKSKDGEMIGKVLTMGGMKIVRGSSSRNAVAATMELIDVVKGGVNIGILPDGPKGPARVVKPGIIYLAQKTGCPIMPITSATNRKLVINSWDRLQIPLPFGRVWIIVGKPFYVRENDDLDAKARALAKALDEISERADQLARGKAA